MGENGPAHLYEDVAAHVAALIERGALRAGDRLPSLRRFARERTSASRRCCRLPPARAPQLMETRPSQATSYRRRARRRPAALVPSGRPRRAREGHRVRRCGGADRFDVRPERRPARRRASRSRALRHSRDQSAVGGHRARHGHGRRRVRCRHPACSLCGASWRAARSPGACPLGKTTS